MHTLIIDVGCSKLRVAVYEGDRLCKWLERPTSKTVTELLQCLTFLYADIQAHVDYHFSQMMVISYSDSVFYETTEGIIEDVPVFTEIPLQEGLPPYQIAGKPRNSELKGAGNALLYLKNEVGLGNIKRILPPSTFIASHLTGVNNWRKWDTTHASNSGMWNYETASWCDEMQPFIEAGVIDAEVVSPRAVISQECNPDRHDVYRVFVGGMDSVFANANDVPYNSKPYLSLGTWITASVESYFRKRDERSPTRFVIAPNGTIVEQLCFSADKVGHDLAYDLTTDFFEKRICGYTEPRLVNVFGGWSEAGIEVWQKYPHLQFVQAETEKTSYLHGQAARYAQRASQEADGLHLPIPPNQPLELCF